ncbi:hypothetical protein B0H11DRAFT_2412563 [Mycena galericulata]|nr:hypothetical protein B0H11DRAFT_2412563 [Mycena galericulata]
MIEFKRRNRLLCPIPARPLSNVVDVEIKDNVGARETSRAGLPMDVKMGAAFSVANEDPKTLPETWVYTAPRDFTGGWSDQEPSDDEGPAKSRRIIRIATTRLHSFMAVKVCDPATHFVTQSISRYFLEGMYDINEQDITTLVEARDRDGGAFSARKGSTGSASAAWLAIRRLMVAAYIGM